MSVRWQFGSRTVLVLLVMVAISDRQSCVSGQINVLDDDDNTIESTMISKNTSLFDLSIQDDTSHSPCSRNQEDNDVNMTSQLPCDETTVTDKPKKSVKTDYVGFVAIPLFLILGLFGNSMTVIVMSSQRFRQATCSLILIFLSCSDTALILMQPWNKPWIIKMLGVDVRALSEIGCKIFFVFRRTAKMSSSWLVVFVCFERFIAVCFPLHIKMICTKRNTIIGILSVYVAMFSYTGAWSIFSKITASGKCVPYFVEPDTASLGRAFLIIGTSLYAVIPTILLLIMTPIIVHRLYKQRTKRQEMVQGGEMKNDETMRITVMLLGITTAYIILVSPIWLGHNVAFARGETLFQSTDPVLVIFRQVAQPMEQLNYSINFFLYVLCSRSFRQHVAKLLGCGSCNKDNRGLGQETPFATKSKLTTATNCKSQSIEKSSKTPHSSGSNEESKEEEPQKEINCEMPISNVANNQV